MNIYGKIGLFAGGVLFGSAGFKLLGSRDAKKVYTHTTAAVLRCRAQIMEQVEVVQDNCSDILTDAKAINERRSAQAEAEFIENTAASEA